MRIAPLEAVEPGTILGKSLFDTSNHLLVPSGFPLSETDLAELNELGVKRVFVMEASAFLPRPGNMIQDLVHKVVKLRVALNDPGTDVNQVVLERCSAERIRNDVYGCDAWAGTRSTGDTPQARQIRDRVVFLVERAFDDQRDLFLAFPEELLAEKECDHALSVAIHALILALHFDLPERDLRVLTSSALVHDLGLYLLGRLHEKPYDSLGKDERMMLREHPCYSAMLLRGADPGTIDEQRIVLDHHEHLDGTGYPQGLKSSGDDPLPTRPSAPSGIHRLAEILAVADAWDNLLRGEEGMEAMSPLQAASWLLQHSGSRYNPGVVSMLFDLVQRFPAGSQVRIRSNSSGRNIGFSGVVREAQEMDDKPPVKTILLTHNIQGPLERPLEVDFSQERHLLLEMLS